MFTKGTIIVSYSGDDILYGECYEQIGCEIQMKVLYSKRYPIGEVYWFIGTFTKATEENIKTLNKLLVFL